MSTYTANIEIAVKGAQELKRLSDQIQSTSELVQSLNNYIGQIGVGSSVRNIQSLSKAVDDSAYAFRQAALGTNEATVAAQAYALATKELNAGLAERVALLKEIADTERQQRLASKGIRDNPTAYTGPIGPGAASPVALSSKLGNRIENILKERQGAAELELVLANLAEKDRELSNSKLDAKALAIQTALDNEAAGAAELTAILTTLEQKDRELSNSKLDAKALAIQTALDKQATAAAQAAIGAAELAAILGNLEEQDRLVSNSKLDAKALAIQTALDNEAKGAAELELVLANLQEQDRLLSNSKLDAKALAIQTALDKEAASAAEAALAAKKLTQEMEAASAASADFYSKGRLRQAAAETAYKQANTETYGYTGKVPALLPEGMTSASAGMLNTVNDRIKQENIITSLRKTDEKLFIQYKIEQTQRAYDIQIDEVDRLLAAQIKADEAFWASHNKRWKLQSEQEVVNTAKKQKFNQRNESLALGVGFPLMFGAGPGMLAGSLAGSFMGSGFGGQILGGGLGQKLDEAAKAAADFSRSMRDGGDAVGYLTEKLGYVNPETKRLIQNLQESGQTAKAAALAQRELGDVIGPNATKDLKAFGDVWDYVGRKFQTFTLSVTANLPKFTAQLTTAVAGITIPGGTGGGSSLGGILAGKFTSAGLQKLGAAVAPKETPETKAATEKTKELRDQLTIAKANYTVTLQNATLDEKAYITAKAQTLQAQKTADYEKIIKDTKNGKLSPAQKLLEVQKLEVDYASKARDLDKERVQLLDQRNQVALAQAQAGMQVGILQQQVQLAREQNTASDVRKASLQGQIGIQQALNNLETINLQIAQERAKTQKDINQNKIKELEAQRNVANTQVDLAQAQAAQQTQQAQISTLAAVYGIAKDRINVEKDILNVNQQLVEIYGTTGQILQSQVNTSTAIYKANKASLDIEQKIEMMQNPSMVDLIADKYKKRLELLEKQFDVQQAIDAQTTRKAEATQSKILTGGTIDFAITAGSIQDKIAAANLDMSMRGKSDTAKASAELALTQESETRQRNLQFTKEMLQLEEEIYSSSGQAQQNLQLEYETRLNVNTEVEKLYENLYAVQEQQLKLNNFATEYGSLIQDIGGSIQSGLVGAIDAAITGAQSLQDVLSGVLKDIGKMLISFGVRALLGGIQINGVPLVGKAVGGPVAGGTPYMVGEKGPELFVPGSSGTIIPADTTAAMTRYQRQTATAGGAGANGGATGDGSPASWAMNFETTQFLGQDWVSKDQLMAAMAATEKRATAAGAKAGAQQVATKMRTSPAFRRQVGV